MSHDKHYAGRFVAEVVSVDDPEKRCRIKVNVYDIFDGVPVRDLPWAVFSLPLGSRAGEGMLCPVRVGDMVWVEFIGGDTRRPVVVGGAHASPGGVPTLPPEIFQGAGQFEHKRTPDEPPVQTPPYYEDVVFCQNRALIQFCRSGHLRVTQMDSGSAIEILPSGDMVVHCEGNMYASVKGNVLEAVEGDYTQKISGSFTQTVEGQMTFSSGGEASFGSTQSSLSLSAKTHGEMTGGGGLTFNGDTTMRDNLTCEKHVEAASIHSSGDIIAAGSNSNHHSH
ncbi:phage baseplate assembly protein V [Desulfovibrio piger]|uniref:phage baseplate assembly protein V n=1 Tax=Desulfovibrio piger TaxID=901 RepID=UPI0026EE2974|nr:phage baseplate assembly protein V [Desulfovibrio piger]